MAEGKWITDLTPETPLEDAARRVLTVRLEVVHEYLPLALERWTEDSEHVHQLRVGTRRAGAALAIFEPCLPRKVFKRVRKRLRKVRRAAGEARDWDVFTLTLAEREAKAAAAHRPGLDLLIGYSNGQRVAAQAALSEASPDAPFDFEKVLTRAVGAVRAPRGRSLRALRDLAQPWLGDLLERLHEAASSNLDQYEQLHKVRI